MERSLANPLHSQELATLGETHGVKPVLQVLVSGQHGAGRVDLRVGVQEEPVKHVLQKAIAHLNGVDVDTRDLALDQVHDGAHTDGVTARVTCMCVCECCMLCVCVSMYMGM